MILGFSSYISFWDIIWKNRQTDRQTDRQTSAAENLTPATTLGVGNKWCVCRYQERCTEPHSSNLHGFSSLIVASQHFSVKASSQNPFNRRHTKYLLVLVINLPPVWVGSTALWSACMYVCLSVCPLSKTVCPNFTQFSVHVLWPWLGSVLTIMHEVKFFVDNVTFSHKVAKGQNQKPIRRGFVELVKWWHQMATKPSTGHTTLWIVQFARWRHLQRSLRLPCLLNCYPLSLL